jgi:hypothetical protein
MFGRKRFDLWAPHRTGHFSRCMMARPVTPFLHEAVSSCTEEGGEVVEVEEEEGRLSVTLAPGDCLFLPAGWWHATETLGPEQDDTDTTDNRSGASCAFGASVNFFCAATYSAIGVVPPDIFPSDWPVGFEPR